MTSAQRKDPRVVGGCYFSGYWRQEYTVVDIGTDGHGFTTWAVVWADGRRTTHATPWDWRRDEVRPAPCAVCGNEH